VKPLRRIITETLERGIEWEYLECGHRLMRMSDLSGPTNASRRRCWKCLNRKPQDFDPSTINQPD